MLGTTELIESTEYRFYLGPSFYPDTLGLGEIADIGPPIWGNMLGTWDSGGSAPRGVQRQSSLVEEPAGAQALAILYDSNIGLSPQTLHSNISTYRKAMRSTIGCLSPKSCGC